LYGINQVGIIPLGSAFGEEVAFRGLMQREMHLYTGSLMLAILSQTALFTALHPSNSRVAAGLGGLYFGYLTHRFNGNLEQAIAAHFWIDVLAGFIDYLRFRLSYGKDVPWSPNLSIGFGIPL
jgi:membrane protease YdiL (CAAX protease family)